MAAVQLILSGGATEWVLPDPLREDGATPLHVAASHGFTEVVLALLHEAPGDVDTRRDTCGRTALHAAAAQGRAATVAALVEAGASVNLQRDNGSTALHAAAAHGHTAMVELLLAKGAAVNQGRDDNGKTALHVAVSQGRLDVVDVLLVRLLKSPWPCPLPRTSPSFQSAGARRPLPRNATPSPQTPPHPRQTAGAEPDAARDNGKTALHIGASFGHLPIVERLLAASACVSATESHGEPAAYLTPTLHPPISTPTYLVHL